MKRASLLIILSAFCAFAQSLDFSSLDKLASKAKAVNRVSLDQSQLRAALQMMSAGKDAGKADQLKKLVSGLSSVYVRNFEFDRKGEYSDADLHAIRRQMERMRGWAKVIDSKEENEHAEVFMLTEENKPMGIAVIDAEPKEVSVIFIKGALNLSDLGNLGGLMGLPHLQMGPVSPGAAEK